VLANANSDAISFATLLNCAGCTIVTCDGHQLTATLVDYPMGGTPHSAEANALRSVQIVGVRAVCIRACVCAHARMGSRPVVEFQTALVKKFSAPSPCRRRPKVNETTS
jgi:hypothetical protein